jgi:hypothetical protein
MRAAGVHPPDTFACAHRHESRPTWTGTWTGPDLTKVGPDLTKVGPDLTKVESFGPDLTKVESFCRGPGPDLTKVESFGPDLTKVESFCRETTRTTRDQTSPRLNPSVVDQDQTRPHQG